MAGTFPDAPGPRIAYHLDSGVVAKRYKPEFSGPPTINTYTTIQKAELNDEDRPGFSVFELDALYGDGWIGIYFPYAIDLAGYFAEFSYTSVYGPGTCNVQTSTNTTTLEDGTWTSHGAATLYESTRLYYRNVTTLSVAGIRGFRLFAPQNGIFERARKIGSIHLYGSPSSTPTSGLAMWHPSSNTALGGADLDFGTSTRGTTSSSKTFRVKNLSATQTANTVTLTLSGDSAARYTLSTDNVTYASTVSVGSLSAGTISSTIYIKRTTPSTDTLHAQTAILTAEAASWS